MSRMLNQNDQTQMIKFYLSDFNATIFDRVLKCNGRRVVITLSKPYLTSDPDEIKELGQYRFLANSDPDDLEIRRYALDPENLPRIAGNVEKLEKVAPFWKWTQSDEKAIAKILELRGYKVDYIKDKDTEEYYAGQADDIMIAALTKRGYIVTMKPDLSDLTKAELLKLVKEKFPDLKLTGRESNSKLVEILNG